MFVNTGHRPFMAPFCSSIHWSASHSACQHSVGHYVWTFSFTSPVGTRVERNKCLFLYLFRQHSPVDRHTLEVIRTALPCVSAISKQAAVAGVVNLWAILRYLIKESIKLVIHLYSMRLVQIASPSLCDCKKPMTRYIV